MFNLPDINSFNNSYTACRALFLARLRQLQPAYVQYQAEYKHPQVGPDQALLACDVCLLSQSATPSELVVVISATHGVEGFAGSAVQSDLLSQLEPVLQQHVGLGVLMIHALNPWGFAWLRRSDHDGIDLNRNFVDFQQPLPENHDYLSWQSRLFATDWSQAAARQTPWAGEQFATLMEQLTRGQYSDAQGLFYGGKEPAWSRECLSQITSQAFIKKARHIAVIDLHTGLGPYGYGEIINDHEPASAGDNWVQRLYGHNAMSALQGESVSTPKHGLHDYHWHQCIAERGCFVTLEFGTYSPLQIIKVLVQEQIYHNQLKVGASREPGHAHVQALKQFFYPQERSWQQQVLFRARQTVTLAIAGIVQ